jgi:iron complex outermembrane receptor protein
LSPGAPVPLNVKGFANGEFEHFEGKSYAGYGHVTFHLWDKFDLSGGLRYTVDDKRDQVPQIIVDIFNAQLLPSTANGELTSERVNYDVSLTYKVTSDVNLYVRYGTAYLAGGFFNGTSYLPEDTWSAEGGIKSEWLDHRLRVNADAYYQSTDDFQDVGISPGGGILVTNIPGTTVNSGFELDTSFVPMRGLTFNGNVGFAHIKYPDGRANPAPEWTATVSGEYDTPHFSNGMFLSFRADASYLSKYYSNRWPLTSARGGYVDLHLFSYVPPANPTGTPQDNYYRLLQYLSTTMSQPSWNPATNPNAELNYVSALDAASNGGDYWLTNLRVALVDIPVGRLKAELSGYVNNLFDVRAPTDEANYGGYLGMTYEQSRTYGVDLRVKF